MAERAHPLGILILHGFSTTLWSVDPLGAALEALGLPVRMPLLRGHGADSPEALRGVSWRDWVADGESALEDLLSVARRVIAIGHSMGGLVALALAAGRAEAVDSLVLAAAAVDLANPVAPGRPLAFVLPLIERLFRDWKLRPNPADPAFARGSPNYPWVPNRSIAELFDFSRITRSRLAEVGAPTLILQGRRDTTVAPGSARIILEGISTPAAAKRIAWFDRTEHQMMRGAESEAVIRTVVEYVEERRARSASL